jgi:hypothetical protein
LGQRLNRVGIAHREEVRTVIRSSSIRMQAAAGSAPGVETGEVGVAEPSDLA